MDQASLTISFQPKHFMTYGDEIFMRAIYMHNHVAFKANLFYPYKRSIRCILVLDPDVYMIFRPNYHNLYDCPYGEDGHYKTLRTHHITKLKMTLVDFHGLK